MSPARLRTTRSPYLYWGSEYDVQETQYEHMAYRCGKCGQFYQRFYVLIEYDGDNTYKTEYKCPKCRKDLEEVKEQEMEHYPCPACHQKELLFQETMMWD